MGTVAGQEASVFAIVTAWGMLFASITTTDGEGRERPVRPFTILCESAKLDILDPGATRQATTRVFWSTEGFAFGSGMAAITTITQLLKSGDHVVASNNMYGGTYRLFERVVRPFGLDFTYVDTSCLNQVEAAFRPSTRMLFIETPTNPSMIISDLR